MLSLEHQEFYKNLSGDLKLEDKNIQSTGQSAVCLVILVMKCPVLITVIKVRFSNR